MIFCLLGQSKSLTFEDGVGGGGQKKAIVGAAAMVQGDGSLDGDGAKKSTVPEPCFPDFLTRL